LRTYPQVQIAFHGPLRPPPEFSKFKSRVFTIPFLDPGDYYRAIASWDVSIAPLTQHQFNDAKSNIKFLEASVFGVPSVCSPTEPFRAAVNHGKNGMLATTETEWFDALETLIKDPQLRKRLGEQARRDVVKRYSLKAIGEREVRRLLPTVNRNFSKHRPRVLEVNLLFSPTSFGGATVVAEQMATRLSREGVEVGVVTGLNDTGFPPLSLVRYEALGLPVFGIQLPAGGDPVLEYRNHSLGIVFGQILDTFKPDVMHFHSIQQLSASMLEVCRERKVPFVVTAHDAWWLCQRQFMVNRDNHPCGQRGVDLRVCSTCVADPKVLYDRDRALRSALAHAELILTPSKFQRRLYLENGFSRDRVRLNKNGVSVPVVSSPRQRDLKAPLRLGYMGGKAHHKGYFWLREILKRVRGEDYVFKLVDIHRKMGPSPIKLADFKIRGKLDVVAPFSPDRADDFYAGIDVLLMPSLAPESFGLSIREALARNVWVITTDAGALSEEVVDGENGNVIRVGDTTGFANAIDRLLSAPSLTNYDNPHRKKIRGYEEQALELKQFLLEAIKHKPAAARHGA
jgi:glycosyltransferase involved in cell wall biosynthesis